MQVDIVSSHELVPHFFYSFFLTLEGPLDSNCFMTLGSFDNSRVFLILNDFDFFLLLSSIASPKVRGSLSLEVHLGRITKGNIWLHIFTELSF